MKIIFSFYVIFELWMGCIYINIEYFSKDKIYFGNDRVF